MHETTGERRVVYSVVLLFVKINFYDRRRHLSSIDKETVAKPFYFEIIRSLSSAVKRAETSRKSGNPLKIDMLVVTLLFSAARHDESSREYPAFLNGS